VEAVGCPTFIHNIRLLENTTLKQCDDIIMIIFKDAD